MAVTIAIESQNPKLAVLVLGSKLIVTGVSHCLMHDQKLIMPYDLWARTEDFLTVPCVGHGLGSALGWVDTSLIFSTSLCKPPSAHMDVPG